MFCWLEVQLKVMADGLSWLRICFMALSVFPVPLEGQLQIKDSRSVCGAKHCEQDDKEPAYIMVAPLW
jgi:hypothetical protein